MKTFLCLFFRLLYEVLISTPNHKIKSLCSVLVLLQPIKVLQIWNIFEESTRKPKITSVLVLLRPIKALYKSHLQLHPLLLLSQGQSYTRENTFLIQMHFYYSANFHFYYGNGHNMHHQSKSIWNADYLKAFFIRKKSV